MKTGTTSNIDARIHERAHTCENAKCAGCLDLPDETLPDHPVTRAPLTDLAVRSLDIRRPETQRA
jgi:hypothetical protein